MHIALVANSTLDAWRFRRPLIEALREQDIRVSVIAPADIPDPGFRKMGVTVYPWRMNRGSTNLRREGATLLQLAAMYRQLRPDLVHQFTAKPVLYGTLVARSLPRPPAIVSTLTGLGHVFVDPGRAELRFALGKLYRQSLRWMDALLFLNDADPRTLGISSHPKVHVIEGGEGVDTECFSPAMVSGEKVLSLRKELGVHPGDVVVLMVSRLIAEKGVREFVEVAGRLRRQGSAARCVLVGPVDTQNPSGILADEVTRWAQNGEVLVLGQRDDVRELLALADIVVLPSYREGLSVTLLEGAAMAKPLVASDIAGCREIVRPAVNGLLVPPRDVAALERAVEALVESDTLRKDFGAASRVLAVTHFSAGLVVDRLLAIYRTVLAARSAPGLLPWDRPGEARGSGDRR